MGWAGGGGSYGGHAERRLEVFELRFWTKLDRRTRPNPKRLEAPWFMSARLKCLGGLISKWSFFRDETYHNLAKVGLTLVRIFLNLSNHRGPYVQTVANSPSSSSPVGSVAIVSL